MKFIHMILHAVRMKYIWTSYQRTNEVNMLYPCHTNDMRFINSSHKIHLKFIWISNDLNFTWIICELHKNYMTSAQECLCTTHGYGFWHPCYVLHMNEPPSLSYISHCIASRILRTIRTLPRFIVVWFHRFHAPFWHDDVIKWKRFPCWWPFVRGIHRSQRPVTRSFDAFFDLNLNNRLSKQSRCWWLETPSLSMWRHCYGHRLN